MRCRGSSPLKEAFVSELFRSAAAVDRIGTDWLVAALAGAVRRSYHPRAFREPCREDLAVAAEARILLDRLPFGHPARRLYLTIRDQANEAIASAEEADRGLEEQ